jgi:hypothetical protein
MLHLFTYSLSVIDNIIKINRRRYPSNCTSITFMANNTPRTHPQSNAALSEDDAAADAGGGAAVTGATTAEGFLIIAFSIDA